MRLKHCFNGGRQGDDFISAETSICASEDQHLRHATYGGYLRTTKCFSINNYLPDSALVAVLVSCRGPSAVLWLVVLVTILAFQCVPVWAMAHIRQEVGKPASAFPSFTHANPSPAIIMVVDDVRVAAPGIHCHPGVVGARSIEIPLTPSHSVRCRQLIKPPLGTSPTPSRFPGPYSSFPARPLISAIAPTKKQKSPRHRIFRADNTDHSHVAVSATNMLTKDAGGRICYSLSSHEVDCSDLRNLSQIYRWSH